MSDVSSGRAAPSLCQVGAVLAGNALEFYDFLTFSFFAAQIGKVFFPSDRPGASLLASLATFGAGFLTRPIGAVVIGRFADRRGRKPALLLSFMLMGLAVVGLAVMPSAATIGLLAPIGVVLCRLVQGFAVGGELGSSTAFLMEAAPPHRRGAYVSLQYVGQGVAVLAAGLVGMMLAGVLDEAALRDYGWRIALLVGATIIPFGIFLRAGLVETLDRPEPAATLAAPVSIDARRGAILAFLILASATIGTYVLNYMTTYAQVTLHMPAQLAFGATVINGLTCVIFSLVGGALSDRFGRRIVMASAGAALLVMTLPSFYLIAEFRSAGALLGLLAVLGILLSISSGASLPAITEALPKHARATGLSLVYALAIMTFGGSAQFVVAWLTQVTGNPLAPAWYMSAAGAIGLLAMLLMKETAPVKLGRAQPSAPPRVAGEGVSVP